MKHLTSKHVLIDTCVLINYFKYFESTSFKTLFNDLKVLNCIPVGMPLIRHEFTRLALSENHYKDRIAFLETLTENYEIPLTPDIWLESDLISRVSVFVQKPITKLTDSIIAAYLKKYDKNLCLLTSDIQDFQLPFLKRITIKAIDVDKEIVTMAFYQFDIAEFSKIYTDFKKYKS